MKRMDLIKNLARLERLGVYVLPKRDLRKIFPVEDEKSLEKSLQRVVKDGLLVRAAKGIYVNPLGTHRHPGRVIEEVAKALRPGKISYVSLESMLSEHGVISQIPVSYLTVMTTGASGRHSTPYGEIEFTHTKRSVPDVLERSVYVEGRPMRIAKKKAAAQDLYRVGRNTNMIDREELEEELEEEVNE